MGLPVRDEGPVELFDHLGRLLVVRSDDDAVRFHEIVNRSSLFEKLGIGDDSYGMLRQRSDPLMDTAVRADGNRALDYDDFRPVHSPADPISDGEHVRRIRGAVLVGRGSDGDEQDLRAVYRLVEIRGEAQALLGNVSGNELTEPGLVDGDLTPFETLDLVSVDIDGGDGGCRFRPDSWLRPGRRNPCQ